ncbi:MAG TPA: 2OG-Fe(II) oxygenase [Vicinamibacteria bacterium]|nr:2OG-Fe(II) oxygenase [Vicinamibacteria bacterium]
MIDYERFRKTPLVREPFDHLVVSGFLQASALEPVLSGFPPIDKGGSFPVSELSFGPRFGALLEELRRPELRAAVEEKFGIDLAGRPTMVTVRGQARAKDGRIHTDTETKIVTVLLYLNPGWKGEGGRLRLLRSSASLDDHFADIPPEIGTAVFFRCTDNAWHGHTPYVGERRAIQLNWVTDESVVRHEERRHRISARLKKWLPV